jgi:hypothetical protein
VRHRNQLSTIEVAPPNRIYPAADWHTFLSAIRAGQFTQL